MDNIRDRLSRVGISLRSYAAGSHKVPCPRCSHLRSPANKKDPCLSVTIKDGGAVWMCHGCQWTTPVPNDGSADSIAFWGEKRSGATTPPRQRSAPPPPSQPPANGLLPLKGGAKRWFASRGITEQTLERMKIATAMHPVMGPQQDRPYIQPCIAFPYFENGKVVDVKYRTQEKNFAHAKGARKVLYNIDSLNGKDVAVIVEGEIDVLSMQQAGIEEWAGNVSLPDGAPGNISASDQDRMDEKPDPETDSARYKPLWDALEKHPQVKRWILAGDGDKAGLVLRQQLARRIGKERCMIVDWPTINDAPLKDANEVLQQEGAQVLRECVENARPHPISGLYRVSDFKSQVEQLYLMGRPRMLSTGFPSLDKLLKIPEASLIVVTGAPSQGKSEFADSLCMNLAVTENAKVAYCSMENRPGEDHIPKIAQKYLRKSFFAGDLIDQRMTRAELAQAMAWAEDHFLFMQPADDDVVTIEWILERAQRAVNMFGIKILVVDPYNEVTQVGKETQAEYLSAMLGKVKRFLHRNGVTCIFVAHPTKLQRDRSGVMVKPSLYDIAGGAHWYNKMDIGIVVERQWFTTESIDGIKRMHRSNKVDIDVRKVRFSWIGQCGTATLVYNQTTSQHEEIEE